MREKKFKKPVVVVPSRIDRERIVSDVRHATVVSLREWPFPASSAKQKAMKDGLDVLARSHQASRSAFFRGRQRGPYSSGWPVAPGARLTTGANL